MFFKGSRYETVEDHELTEENGRVIRYKTVRLITSATVRYQHTLTEGERLDHLASRYYRDPERFWRICDANEAMWPEDLTADPGDQVDIPGASER